MSDKKSNKWLIYFLRATHALGWAPCAVSPFIRAAGRNEADMPFEFWGRAFY